MGERTGLIVREAHPLASPEQLEHDVDDLRAGLTGIIRELDRRRHELLDWRSQAQRHRVAVVVVVAAGLFVLGRALWLAGKR
ncbi:MAG: hypothetical protein Q8O67_16865 [Deltaproteobacteria bacterium]|nr:hypothetical protein [Deltaproteobacteria bacterium]